jgi:aconitate hydratase
MNAPWTSLTCGVEAYRCIDLRAHAGGALGRLPWIHRILLENVLRTAGVEAEAAARAILASTGRASSAEVPFRPGRILMHDTTFTPAFVDLAGMRDAVAEAGGDPSLVNPRLPVDVSVDHSIAADHFGAPDALARNMEAEIERNRGRYHFMKWATQAMSGVRIHPPGTGIMHTLNLERLASVVATLAGDGGTAAFPDTLIGTDSHTPMVNGIGVLGWGVGGLEAESALLGLPVMLRVPDVVGVRLTGSLREGTLATDLALALTETLRPLGLAGRFVEFFGPGVSTLSAGQRAVAANMAPEYGASTGFFAIDEQTLRYLEATGRSASHVDLVARYAREQGLWFDPEAEPDYSDVVEFDLDRVAISLAGPRRPQDRLPPGRTPAILRTLVADRPLQAPHDCSPPDGAVAIAAITSCTNTSDPRLMVAAGLVARRARRLGLRPPWWVKTSSAPGSPAAARYLRRAGLLEDLEALGFGIVGYGCTTCIGNSGPLVPRLRDAVRDRGIVPVAVLSGNRNFPGRIHPEIDAAFLASPPLVVAYALAGDVARDVLRDPLGRTPDGTPVRLADLWPSGKDIDDAMAAVDPADVTAAYDEAEASAMWKALDAPRSPLFPWDPASTDLRRPPYATAAAESRLGLYVAHPLLVLGDDVTTDHISPAGSIAANSDAGRYLVERGEQPLDLNVFAARRGNWEVMVRGLFTNRAVRNLLGPDLTAGLTVHVPSGDRLPAWRAAERYRREGTPLVLVAGHRYGAGSSRDWAAKGPALLGVRAVLAASFERIHRSNLVGMGVLPLRLPEGMHPRQLALVPGDRVEVEAAAERLEPRGRVPVRLLRAAEGSSSFEAVAEVETAREVTVLRSGGIIPFILRQAIGGAGSEA